MPDAPAAPAATDAPPAATDAPPANQPPASQPPANQPPANEPPADDQGANDPRVTRANQEAAASRVRARELQQQLDQATASQQTMLDNIAVALGLKPEAGADPAAQVNTLTGQVSELTTRNSQLEAELLVHTLAPEHQANAVALLDSRSFANKLHGLDPAADDYRTQVAAAIKDAVSTTPTLRSGQAPSAGGTDNAGQGAGGADSVSQEQFDRMSYKERTDLFRTDPALYRRLSGG